MKKIQNHCTIQCISQEWLTHAPRQSYSITWTIASYLDTKVNANLQFGHEWIHICLSGQWWTHTYILDSCGNTPTFWTVVDTILHSGQLWTHTYIRQLWTHTYILDSCGHTPTFWTVVDTHLHSGQLWTHTYILDSCGNTPTFWTVVDTILHSGQLWTPSPYLIY